ncbi:MAG: hypothetical protein P8Y44_01265 [Acidobacteriota bacterium]
MCRWHAFGGVAVLLLLVTASSLAAAGMDLSGTWTLTMEGESPTGAESVDMIFSGAGTSLVATMKGEAGDVDCRGFADGNQIRFYYIRPTEDGEFIAKYTGHVAGDLMGGEVDMGEMGKTTWRATRSPDKGIDLSGSWNMTMEMESPTGADSVDLSFQQEGSSLVVTMTSDAGKTECEGWIDGNALRFYYIRPTSDGDFIAKYTGHVGGDVMGGEVDMGERGKTQWKATRSN